MVALGPKVLDGQDRRALREVGVSIDRAGRRVTGHRARRDRPGPARPQPRRARGRARPACSSGATSGTGSAGSTPGSSCSATTLTSAGGLRRAGYRVQVVTDAVLYHRELSARRRRDTANGEPRRLRQLDRRNALYVLAVNLPLLTMLRVVGRVRGRVAGPGRLLPADQAARPGRRPALRRSAGFSRTRLRLWRAAAAPRRGRSGGLLGGPHVHPARAHALPARGEDRGACVQTARRRPRAASPGGLGRVGRRRAVRRHAVRRSAGSSANPGVQLFVALLVIALVAERQAARHQPARRRRAGARLGRRPARCGGSTWRASTRSAWAPPLPRRRTWRSWPRWPRCSAARPGWRSTSCCSAACRLPG